MKSLRLAALLCALPLLAADSPSAIAGVWRAQLEGQLALVISLVEDSGQLAGAVLFYARSVPDVPEPLLRVKFDGRALDFQVSRQRGQEPPVSFRLLLVSPNKGKLIREGDETQAIEMQRDK